MPKIYYQYGKKGWTGVRADWRELNENQGTNSL